MASDIRDEQRMSDDEVLAQIPLFVSPLYLYPSPTPSFTPPFSPLAFTLDLSSPHSTPHLTEYFASTA